jgi:Family of unknown function (DUF6522)
MTADALNPSSSLLDEASATTIAFEDGAVQVSAAVIAYGFDLEAPMVQSLMRSGELTSLCEKRENEDIGRYRLTFFYMNRRLQLVIDSTGKILQRSVIDFGGRELPAALDKPGI